MTKERRIAIQIWRDMYDTVEAARGFQHDSKLNTLKETLCNQYDVRWRYDCWFCHYMRANASSYDAGCVKCPLMKAEMLRDEDLCGTECGCALYDSFFMTVVEKRGDNTKVLRAIKAIIQLLEGKKPEQVVEEFNR